MSIATPGSSACLRCGRQTGERLAPLSNAMTDRDWKNLMRNVQAETCVAFLGPGVYDSDNGLAGHLAGLLGDKCPAAGASAASLAQCFERVPGFGGRNALVEEVQNFFRIKPPRLGKVGECIAATPFPLVLTTLLDDSLLDAFQRTPGKAPRPMRYDPNSRAGVSLPTWTKKEPLVYHLHGRLRDGDPVVLTEHDQITFLKAMVTDQPPIPTSIVAHLRRAETAFLFLGFGLGHPYLKFFLSHFRTSLRRNDSYALEAAGAAMSASDTVIFYGDDRVAFGEESIQDFASELARRSAQLGSPGTPVAEVRPSVFISYASEDRAHARKLYNALESERFDVWLDKVRLEGGDRWDEAIENEIDRSEYILVLQSSSLLRKLDSYVNREIQSAKRRCTRVRSSVNGQPLRCVIPVRVEDCGIVDDLKDYQAVPLGIQDYAHELNELVNLLRRDAQLRRRVESQ